VAAALVAILGPMLWRGAGAVVFRGTVEFRKMQLEQYGRGVASEVRKEAAACQNARLPVYAALNRFKRGLDTSHLADEARRLAREYGKQLRGRDTSEEARAELVALSREIRDRLTEAFETTDKAEALAALDNATALGKDPRLAGTLAEQLLALGADYRPIAETVDLTRRPEYAKALAEVQEALTSLFGPRPGEPRPALTMDQYGATRWDKAQQHLRKILLAKQWVATEPGRPLREVEVPREQQFAGTALEPVFEMLREDIDAMMHPRMTLYLGYLTDDSISGHFFGGVGPEILGTLLVTVLAIAFALPLGVISAAYLVECAGDGRAVRLIRTCINTLAGVPSIVFGLFGLAFFVLWVQPSLGLGDGSTILAGAWTLGLLVLPIIIRASEEAIRSVPQTYKEAALALGASRLRSFVTVVLPAALPGILTGTILSISRAAGETAPILFTAAVAVGPAAWPPWAAILKPTRTLAYSSYHIAVGDRIAAQAPHNQFGMVATLIVLVLALNIVAIVVRSRVARKLRGT
jgi:phosphate transport system permease protein